MEALVVSPGTPPTLTYDPNHHPPQPAPGEVCIRVHRAGICSTDLEILRGYMTFAGIPGHEFVGTVIEGPNTLHGQRVVAEINCACGQCDTCRRGLPNHCPHRTVVGIAGRPGAFAEQICVPAENCHIVPDEIDDDEAVFVEPLAAAAQILALESIEPSQKVTVVGSGRLGLLCAQVLHQAGLAPDVIGRNKRTLKLCASWGIATQRVTDVQPAADRDFVIECTGSPDGLRLALQLCRPRATIVLKSTFAGAPAIDLAPIVIHEIRVVGNRCGPFAEAIRLLRERKVAVKELITATFPLSQGLAAIAAAEQPEHIKVLLTPGAP